MEDIKDKLSHEGKKYYMSHLVWVYTDKSPLFKVIGNDSQKLTQLVCASNIQNAKIAVENGIYQSVESKKELVIIQNRIDHPIVGD